MRPTLVIFVKEPRAGRVKTRLGRDIGMTSAAWWFRHQVSRLLRQVGDDPRWRTVLAVSPDTAVLSRAWPAHLPRWPQGRGDLGDRMGRAFRQMPPGPVIIVGADIPGITRGRIADSFAALRSNDAVLGPAPDGGYWLIGLRRGGCPIPRKLFDGVRWSTEHAMADTVATMAGLKIARTITLADVDTRADLDT
ncbi:MAG: TIGR04282 family arsenosugar biosynthesis glycosyltransferase [Pseudomonadota bacterium]